MASQKPNKISVKNVPRTWCSIGVRLVTTEQAVLIFSLVLLFIALEQVSVMVITLELAFAILATRLVFIVSNNPPIRDR